MGNARYVPGVVWYDGRRVSAFEGTAAHLLLMCMAASGDVDRLRESQYSCQRGEGRRVKCECNAYTAGKCMCGMSGHERQGPGMNPISSAALEAPSCAPVCSARRT